MSRQRGEQEILEIDDEAGSVFGAGGSWSGSEAQLRIRGLDKSALDSEMIEDESYRLGPGSHGHFEGLAKIREEPMTFDAYVEGHGAAVDTGSPTDTVLSRLMETWAQMDADAFDGDTVTGSPTATSVPTTGNTHEPAGDSKMAIGAFSTGRDPGVDEGTCSVRPFQWTVGDILDLAMELPAAPVASDDLAYGGLCVGLQQTFASPVAKSLGVRVVGNGDEQHGEVKGGVLASWEIPEAGPGEVPSLSASVLGTDYAEPTSLTRTAGSSPAAKVGAGAQVILAAHGNSHVDAIACLKAGVKSGAQLVNDQDVNSLVGVGGFSRGDELPEITVYVPDTETPPAACTASSFREAFRNNKVAGNEMQVLLAWGAYEPGKVAAVYMPHAILADWSREVDNGIAMQKLVYQPVDQPVYGSDAVEPMFVLFS